MFCQFSELRRFNLAALSIRVIITVTLQQQNSNGVYLHFTMLQFFGPEELSCESVCATVISRQNVN